MQLWKQFYLTELQAKTQIIMQDATQNLLQTRHKTMYNYIVYNSSQFSSMMAKFYHTNVEVVSLLSWKENSSQIF